MTSQKTFTHQHFGANVDSENPENDIFHVSISLEERKKGEKFLKSYEKLAQQDFEIYEQKERRWNRALLRLWGIRKCAHWISNRHASVSQQCLVKQDWERSEQYCRKSFAWDGMNLFTWMIRIQTLLCKEQYDAALQTALFVRKLLPWADAILVLAGNAAMRLGNSAAGQILYLEALKYAPENPGLLTSIGEYYIQKGDSESALKCFLKAFHFCKTDYFIESMLSKACFYEKRMFFAELHTRHALKLLLQELPSGVEMSRESELFPTYCDLQLQLTGILMISNQTTEVLEILQHLEQLDPDNPDILQALARYWYTIEDFDKALPLLERLIHQEQSSHMAYFYTGKVYTLQEKYEEAIPYFEYALKIAPDSELICVSYLGCLLAINKFADVISKATRFLQSGLNSPDLYAIRGIARFTSGEQELGCADLQTAMNLEPDSPLFMQNYAQQLHILNLHEESIEICNRALRLNTQQGELHLIRAMNFISLGKLDAADQDLDIVLKYNPLNETAWQHKVRLISQRESPDQAISHLKSILETHSGAVVVFVELGIQLEHQKRFQEGVDWMEALVNQHPDDFHYYMYLSHFQLGCKCYEKALKNVDIALEIAPNEALCHLLRGQIFLDMGNPEAAILNLQNAIRLNPTSPFLWDRYCTIKSSLGLTDEVLNDMNAILKKFPDDPLLMENRIDLYLKLEQYDKALSDCDQILSRKPQMDSILFKRALIHNHKKDYDQALQDINTAIQINPSDLDYRFARVTILSACLEHSKALEEVERILDFDPTSIPAKIQKTLILITLKKYSEAYDLCCLILQDNPNEPIVWNTRGTISLNSDQFDEAISDFNHVIELDPEYVNAYINRSKCFSFTEKHKDALRDLLTARSKSPYCPEIHLELALAHAQLSQLEEADIDLSNAIKFARAEGNEDIFMSAISIRKSLRSEEFNCDSDDEDDDEDDFGDDYEDDFEDDDDEIAQTAEEAMFEEILDDTHNPSNDKKDPHSLKDLWNENIAKSVEGINDKEISLLFKEWVQKKMTKQFSEEGFSVESLNIHISPPFHDKKNNQDWTLIPFRSEKYRESTANSDSSKSSCPMESGSLSDENEELLASITESHLRMEMFRTSRSMADCSQYQEEQRTFQRLVCSLLNNLKKEKASSLLFLSPTEANGLPTKGCILQIRIDLD